MRGFELGTPGVTRTRDLLLRRQALYPLSYGRKCTQQPNTGVTSKVTEPGTPLGNFTPLSSSGRSLAVLPNLIEARRSAVDLAR
jgi:hypothetical protein